MSSDQAEKAVKQLIEAFLNKIDTYEKGRQGKLTPYLIRFLINSKHTTNRMIFTPDCWQMPGHWLYHMQLQAQ